MAATMKAGFFVRGEPGIVSITDVPVPTLEDQVDGTCLLRGLYASICGTDMLMVDQPRDIDWCCGTSVHEVVAEVVEVKGASQKFRPGDRVLALPSNYITSGIFRGMPEATAEDLKKIPLTGGLAQYFLSHESHMYALPKPHEEGGTVPLAHYTAAQPLGTLLWMLRKVPSLLHKTVAVVGQGQNGLLLTHLAANMCARKVIAIDLLPERLEVAKQMKATHTILAGNPASVCEQVLALTDNKGADIVFEMVGHQEETLNECLTLAAREGTVLAFGVPHTNTYAIDFTTLFLKNIHLVAPIFTHTYTLENADKAFALCKAKKDGAIKVLIELT